MIKYHILKQYFKYFIIFISVWRQNIKTTSADYGSSFHNLASSCQNLMHKRQTLHRLLSCIAVLPLPPGG